jgi:predicted RND superfamily exporter protein
MTRLANLIIKFRWWVILLTTLLTGYFGWIMLSVSLNADFSTYLSQDDPAVQEYNRIGDIFGGNDVGVVLLSGENVFTIQNLEIITSRGARIRQSVRRPGAGRPGRQGKHSRIRSDGSPI